jgi:hypothetical protein
MFPAQLTQPGSLPTAYVPTSLHELFGSLTSSSIENLQTSLGDAVRAVMLMIVTII